MATYDQAWQQTVLKYQWFNKHNLLLTHAESRWVFLLGLLSWVAFLQVKTLGFRHFLSFFLFDATLFNVQGTVGRKRIMARAQLLIIHLSLDMTHITSVRIPSVGVGEMEFLLEQVPPRNDSKLQKGSPDLQCQPATIYHIFQLLYDFNNSQ